MVVLLVLNTLVAILLNLDLTDQWLYVVFFGLGTGIFSSFGWPACLCVSMLLLRCCPFTSQRKTEFCYLLGMELLNLETSSL
jgi:hypothetical protein